MPNQRIARTRASLPEGYQFGDGICDLRPVNLPPREPVTYEYIARQHRLHRRIKTSLCIHCAREMGRPHGYQMSMPSRRGR